MRETQQQRILDLLDSQPELEYCYKMGQDCQQNGPNEKNCHFSIFRSPEHTKAWEQGKKSAMTQADKILERLKRGPATSWELGPQFAC